MIPQRVIDRPPSAELAPDQSIRTAAAVRYPDAITEGYVERDKSSLPIWWPGFDEAIVRKVITVDINRAKRRQGGRRAAYHRILRQRPPLPHHIRFGRKNW